MTDADAEMIAELERLSAQRTAGEWRADDNAAFIVAAANAMPRLLALAKEAQAAHAEAERLREALEPFLSEVCSWAPDFPPSGCLLGDHDPPLSLTWGDLLKLDSAAPRRPP